MPTAGAMRAAEIVAEYIAVCAESGDEPLPHSIAQIIDAKSGLADLYKACDDSSRGCSVPVLLELLADCQPLNGENVKAVAGQIGAALAKINRKE